MKKTLIILVTLLCSFIYTNGQEYDKWTIDGGVGIHGISDESATMSEYGLDNFNLGIRYNLSRTFALGARVNVGNTLQLEDWYGDLHELNFNTFHVEGVLNLFNLLDLHSNRVSLLAHGGMGVSTILSNNDYNQTVTSWAGGISPVFKITKVVSIKLDATSVGNIEQSKTLDGVFRTNTSGISSLVNSASIGLSINLGTKGSADYVDEVTKVDTVYVTEKMKPAITNVYNDTSICNCLQSDFVFFDHDKSVIKPTEYNTIYRVYVELVENDEYNLVIRGWVSPTDSSDEYNLILSQHRSKTIYNNFIELGIDTTRISFEAYGKDFGKQLDELHPYARRVELILTK